MKFFRKTCMIQLVRRLSEEYCFNFIDVENDDNVYNIGLASGKFFKHLSLGQPVIVNNVPSLATEVEKYKFGVVINDLSELYTAYKTISDHF